MKTLPVAALFMTLLLAGPAASAQPYLDIQQVETPKGLSVWYVQDDTVPVMTLKFALQGGARLDPAGREGAGELLSALFDEGAGKRDSEAFQDVLEAHAIKIAFNNTRDSFYGSMKTTLLYRDIALELMDDALNRPHLNDKAIARMKDALQSNLRFQLMNPATIAQRRLFQALYDKQPYARPVEGTMESLAAITRDDLVALKNTLFCRERLKIAVVGALDKDAMSVAIDRLFGGWPSCDGDVPENGTQHAALDGNVIPVDWQGAQSVMILAQQGLARQDKDWWAARILDFVLGSGQFSSRLMEEVRIKRGLTYGVSTSLVPLDESPLWVIQAGVDPSKTEQALDVIQNTWRDVAENGITEKEIRDAKDYLIGSLPLMLTSTDAIAGIVLQLQQDRLPVTTLDTRREEIESVTADDIRRVAKERLNPSGLTTILVGPSSIKDKNHE